MQVFSPCEFNKTARPGDRGVPRSAGDAPVGKLSPFEKKATRQPTWRWRGAFCQGHMHSCIIQGSRLCREQHGMILRLIEFSENKCSPAFGY